VSDIYGLFCDYTSELPADRGDESNFGANFVLTQE